MLTRRIELSLPDPLLERVTLVGVRAVPAERGPHAHLLADLVERCESVILVTDGRGPFQPAEIELLRRATELGKGVFFAVTTLTGMSPGRRSCSATKPRWPAEHCRPSPSPWHPVTRSRAGVLELRDSVLAWSRDRRRPRPRRAPAIQVAPDAADTRWRGDGVGDGDRPGPRAGGQLCRPGSRSAPGRWPSRAVGGEELGHRCARCRGPLAVEARRSVPAAIDTVLRTVLVAPARRRRPGAGGTRPATGCRRALLRRLDLCPRPADHRNSGGHRWPPAREAPGHREPHAGR